MEERAGADDGSFLAALPHYSPLKGNCRLIDKDTPYLKYVRPRGLLSRLDADHGVCVCACARLQRLGR